MKPESANVTVPLIVFASGNTTEIISSLLQLYATVINATAQITNKKLPKNFVFKITII